MLENLQGIGPKTIKMLNMMGIYNVLDLLCYYPYRYDILKRSDISNLSSRDRVVTSGVIDGQPTMIFITEEFRKIIFRVNTGNGILNITVYNRNNLYKDLAQGKVVTVIGVYDRSKNTVIASSVRFEELPVSPKIDSVYRLYNVMSKRGFEKVLKSGTDWMMSDSQGDMDRDLARALQGSLPDFIIDRYNFISMKKAIAEVHNPSDIAMLKRARKRLKYEELFNYLLRNKYLAKRIRESKRCIKRRDFSKDVYGFIEKEGIVLSPSQRGCIGDILGDFNRTGRMYRMVMGDRFSGKFLCGMMGCYFNFLAGHKSVILAGSDGECDYVLERIGEIGEKMGMRIGVRRIGDMDRNSNRNGDSDRNSNGKVDNGEVERIGKIDEIGDSGVSENVMGHSAGGSVSGDDYDLLGELREDVSGSGPHSVKAQKEGLIGEAIYNKERKMGNGDAEAAREGVAEADFWGDFDVIICNWNLLGAEMGKSDVGLCVVYNGARGLVNFGALRIFMDSKADILGISDVAISEKRDGLLYEGMDVSRVSAGNGVRPASVDVRVCKGKDREAVLSDMGACLDSGLGVVVVQSQIGEASDGEIAGLKGASSGEMREPEMGFGEVVQEWFGARNEDGGSNTDTEIGSNSGSNIESNIERARNSECEIVRIGNDGDKGIVAQRIAEFKNSKKAGILLIPSEEFDWLDDAGMIGDIICDRKVKMVVIDGGEEYSLARLHGYRCMMAGDIRGEVIAEGDSNDGEKMSRIFDIILNDNERDLKVLEDTTDGFVISDYDFMYKGNEEFDWFKRGDGGMFICNIKRDFNMLERVKDDADKYFELFLDNSSWSEKVLRR